MIRPDFRGVYPALTMPLHADLSLGAQERATVFRTAVVVGESTQASAA